MLMFKLHEVVSVFGLFVIKPIKSRDQTTYTRIFKSNSQAVKFNATVVNGDAVRVQILHCRVALALWH